MRKIEIVVVGAGPAGLSAAIAGAEAGAQVLVVDEYPQPGGQIYRQVPETYRIDSMEVSQDQIEGNRLLERSRSLPLEFMLNTVVWGIFDGRHLSLITGSKGTEIWAETLILAPGAFERPVPFPGWTLPGVMATGGVQNMIKYQKVLPGNRFLITGTGPLQLLVANQLLQSGAEVVGVADAASWRGVWRHILKLRHDWRLALKGLGYLWEIRKRRVPFLRSHAIIRAEGDNQVVRAVTADVDENWHPISGTERIWDVDTVCAGYGFISSVELAVLAGCKIRYEPKWGSWVPEHDQDMKTSVPGVYVAGDGAGLGGAIVASYEGRIAGLNAAVELGYVANSKVYPVRSTHQKLNRLRKFRTAMDAMWPFRDGLYDVIQDDTLICRCEEIPYSEIKAAIAAGAGHVNEIKAWTRAGMGMCQGRFCEMTIAHLLNAETGNPVEKYTVRPPVKPIPIEGVIHETHMNKDV